VTTDAITLDSIILTLKRYGYTADRSNVEEFLQVILEHKKELQDRHRIIAAMTDFSLNYRVEQESNNFVTVTVCSPRMNRNESGKLKMDS